MKVITTEKIPIKLWLDDIEDGALTQAKNIANLPFAFKWISIMPDTHQGYGMPIGGVMATDNVIVPNAVGVDIGCGMMAVKTSLTEITTLTLKNIMGRIREVVPVGFNHHKERQTWEGFNNAPDIPIIQKELQSSIYQIGTLGGGNHFIEIQKGNDGHIWIMLHSGSRNFGLKTASEYHRKAVQLCDNWKSDIPDKELSFLPMDTKEGEEYFKAMNYCLDFAQANRELMMVRILDIFKEITNCMFEPATNIHHNYASLENHFGKNVLVHRKGATLARENTIGIIPGSQGTKSYIVKGKGNKESFESCSHGAGRKMGRNQARQNLNLEEEKKKLDDKGIIHAIRTQKDLDEAPGSYKDIDVVINNQKDLIDILVELQPLAVIKG